MEPSRLIQRITPECRNLASSFGTVNVTQTVMLVIVFILLTVVWAYSYVKVVKTDPDPAPETAKEKLIKGCTIASTFLVLLAALMGAWSSAIGYRGIKRCIGAI